MGLLIVAVIIVLVSIVVLVGSFAFFVWASAYFGRRAYRRATRSDGYVPVTARVTRTQSHGIFGATLAVEYDYGDRKVVNRILTTQKVAQLVQESMQIHLRIDPDYPTDAIVDPAFHMQATPEPSYGWISRRRVEAYARSYAREHPGVNAAELRDALRQRFLGPVDYTQAAMAAGASAGPHGDLLSPFLSGCLAAALFAPLFAMWYGLFSKTKAQVEEMIDRSVASVLPDEGSSPASS